MNKDENRMVNFFKGESDVKYDALKLSLEKIVGSIRITLTNQKMKA